MTRYTHAKRQAAIAAYESARARGCTHIEAVAACGVSGSAVLRWIEEAKLDPPHVPAAARDRKCLWCGGMFASSGPGHRQCDPCRRNGY